MESRARSQSNLVIRPLSGFPRIKKFSNTIIPMFWAEYNQVGLPWYIAGLMYFTVVILPATQMYLSSIFLILWTSLTCLFIHKYIQRKEHEKKPLYSYSSLDLIPSSSSTNSECWVQKFLIITFIKDENRIVVNFVSKVQQQH